MQGAYLRTSATTLPFQCLFPDEMLLPVKLETLKDTSKISTPPLVGVFKVGEIFCSLIRFDGSLNSN